MSEGRFGPGRLALTAGLLAIAFLALRPAVDTDLGWHLANGRHLADGVLFGGVDVYSWTAAGAPWVAHEWLTEVAMAAVHDGLGSLGPIALSLLAALLVMGAFALVVFRLRRRGISRSVTLFSIGLGFAGTLVSMGVRPQLLELLYLAAALLVVDAWLDGHLPRVRLWLVAGGGALLWANTHGSFPLLPVVLGLAAVAALFGGERRWPEMAVATVIAAVVPLANPWGTALYAFAGQSLTSGATGRLVQEWQPPDLLAPSFWPLTLAIALAALGALATLTEGRRLVRPPPRRLAELLVAAALLVLALRSGRHAMLFGIGAAPLIAEGLSAIGSVASRAIARNRPAGPPKAADKPLDRRARDAIDAVVVLVLAVALALASGARIGPDAQRAATDARFPTALLPALDAALLADPEAHLFNEYTWGGFLIQVRPDIPVFIDGRSEVYGDAQLERYAAIAGSPDAATTLESLGIDYVLIETDSPLADALRASNEWRALISDDVGILFVRLRE
jgi:hypothetical protein